MEEKGHTESLLEEVGGRHISWAPQDSHMLHALVVRERGKGRGKRHDSLGLTEGSEAP